MTPQVIQSLLDDLRSANILCADILQEIVQKTEQCGQVKLAYKELKDKIDEALSIRREVTRRIYTLHV